MNLVLIQSHRRTGRITKWRQSHKSPGHSTTAAPQLSEDQKLIHQLFESSSDTRLFRFWYSSAPRWPPTALDVEKNLVSPDGKILDGNSRKEALGEEVYAFWIILIGFFFFDMHLKDTILSVDEGQFEIFQDKLRQ